MPLFSIITVVYNGGDLIEHTLRSVAQQTYQDFEYCIIDGASKDDTLARVAAFQKRYPLSIRVSSEPDRGLYDAMNKGLAQATGAFVLFLNCGDAFYEPQTLEKLAAAIDADTDIVYGEVMLVNDHRQALGTRSAQTTQKLPTQLDWKSLKMGMVVCHQAFLPRRTLAPNYRIDNLAADIDWVILCLKKAKNVVYTPHIVAEYLVGGVSAKQRKQSLIDRFDILVAHYGWWATVWAHVAILFRAVWHKLK